MKMDKNGKKWINVNIMARIYHGTTNWIVMTKYMAMKISGIFGGKIEEGYWKQIVALSPRLLRGDGPGGGTGEC